MTNLIKVIDRSDHLEPAKKSLFNIVAEFLDGCNLCYQADPKIGCFEFRIDIQYTSVQVIINIEERDNWQRITACSVFPVKTPEQRRSAITNATNRINTSLPYGSIEMDIDSGEIRVRTTIETDSVVTEGIIENIVDTTLSISNKYFVSLMAVAFCGSDTNLAACRTYSAD